MILQYNWKSNYFKRFKEHSFGCLCENEEIKLKVLLDLDESYLFGWKGTLARLQLWENLIQFRIETLRQILNTKAQGREGRKASPTSKSTTPLAEPCFCLLDFGLLSKEKGRRRLCSQGVSQPDFPFNFYFVSKIYTASKSDVWPNAVASAI